MQYVAWAVVHLAALILMLVAAAGAGHIFLRKLRFHSLLEQWVFKTVLGLGMWGLALFLLGLVGLLYREVIVALTTLIALVSLWHFVRLYKAFRLPDFSAWKNLFRPRNLLAVLIISIGLSYWIILARLPQYPPMSWDATAYHFVLAHEYLIQHRLVAHEGMVLPVVPALNHLLFTWAMALKDDVLAQLIEHVFMMLTALALYAWGKRQDKRGMGLALAAFWLGQPLVVFLGESGYVDMGIACFAFLGIYAMRVFWDKRTQGWWYLGMALLAMAGGIKLQGLFFLGLAAAAIGLWARARSVLTWRELAQGWVLGLLIVIPFCGFIAYHTGNPFWPAVPSLSKGVWKLGADAIYLSWNHVGVPKTILNFLSLPVLMTIDPQPFLPDAGRAFLPLIILFPIAWIISFFSRSVRWWTLWALAFSAFWFVTSQQLRFWVPAIPLAGLAVYETIQWILERTWKSAAFHGVIWMALALYAIQAGALPSLQVINTKVWPPPMTREARDKFLVNGFPGYSGVKYINEHARPGDWAYSINGSWLNYYFEPKVIDISGLLQIGLHPTFRLPEDEQWLRQIESKNVKWVLVLHKNVPEIAQVPKQDPKLNPFWPDYELVYTDAFSWVFRHKSVAVEAGETVGPVTPSMTNRANRKRATAGVYRPDVSAYLLRNSNSAGNPDLAITFGVEGDIPIVGDWDGDGIVTIGMYRPVEATFYLRNSNTNGDPDILVAFGEPGDIPVVGDWDGDGTTTVGVYRPSTSTFLLRNSNTPGEPDIIVNYGKKGDMPIAGDWDGNGTVTIGVYRPALHEFLLRNSNRPGDPDLTIAFGVQGDVPVVGDWDGNGTATIGVYRPTTFEFLLRNSNTAGDPDLGFSYGVSGDIPIVGSWEGR
jgi:hypothetical protein